MEPSAELGQFVAGLHQANPKMSQHELLKAAQAQVRAAVEKYAEANPSGARATRQEPVAW